MVLIRVLLLFVCLNGFSQSIKVHDLPRLMKDTIVFHEDVWVQTLEQEAKQQSSILGLKRKVNKLSEIIHEKKDIEPIIDSMLTQIDYSQYKIDSLNNVIVTGSIDVISDAQYKIEKYRARISSLNMDIISLTHRLRKTKSLVVKLIAVIIGETILVVVLI